MTSKPTRATVEHAATPVLQAPSVPQDNARWPAPQQLQPFALVVASTPNRPSNIAELVEQPVRVFKFVTKALASVPLDLPCAVASVLTSRVMPRIVELAPTPAPTTNFVPLVLARLPAFPQHLQFVTVDV